MAKKIKDLEVYISVVGNLAPEDILSSKGQCLRESYATTSAVLKQIAKDYSKTIEDLLLSDPEYVHDLVYEGDMKLVETLFRDYKDIFSVIYNKKDPTGKLFNVNCPELREAVRNRRIVEMSLDVDYSSKRVKGIKGKVQFLEDTCLPNQKETIIDYLTTLKKKVNLVCGMHFDNSVLNEQGYSLISDYESKQDGEC